MQQKQFNVCMMKKIDKDEDKAIPIIYSGTIDGATTYSEDDFFKYIKYLSQEFKIKDNDNFFNFNSVLTRYSKDPDKYTDVFTSTINYENRIHRFLLENIYKIYSMGTPSNDKYYLDNFKEKYLKNLSFISLLKSDGSLTLKFKFSKDPEQYKQDWAYIKSKSTQYKDDYNQILKFFNNSNSNFLNYIFKNIQMHYIEEYRNPNKLKKHYRYVSQKIPVLYNIDKLNLP